MRLWTFKLAGMFRNTIILCSITVIVCRVRHSSSTRRDNEDTNSSSNTMSDSRLLARLQSDILSSLGMTELPNANRQRLAPEYARQLARQQAVADGLEEAEHFMERSSSLLLIANKGRFVAVILMYILTV